MQLFLFLELISIAITVTVTGFNFSGIIIIPVMSILTQFPQQNQPNEARNREHSNFLEMVFLENCCRRTIRFSKKRLAGTARVDLFPSGSYWQSFSRGSRFRCRSTHLKKHIFQKRARKHRKGRFVPFGSISTEFCLQTSHFVQVFGIPVTVTVFFCPQN